MSRRFLLSPLAAQDLDDILSYVFEPSGPRQAEHVANRLHDAFDKLAENPELGHRRDDLTSLPVCFWSVWSYLVVYKPASNPLVVVRVLHGARDIESLLSDEPT